MTQTDERVRWSSGSSRATNAHDLDALVACFAEDYENETPVHPGRGFRGRDQVRRNWEQIFAFVPDVRAEVIRSVVDGETVWTEWEMTGTRRDGSAHHMRGVIIFGVTRRDGRAGHASTSSRSTTSRATSTKPSAIRSCARDPRRGRNRPARQRPGSAPRRRRPSGAGPHSGRRHERAIWAMRSRSCVGDVRDAATLAAAIDGVTTVVSAVQGFAGPGRVTPASVDRDGNANLVDAASAVGADVVLMSVVGASPDSPMELFRAKYEAETNLRASGVPLDDRAGDGVRRALGRDRREGTGLRARRQPDQLRVGGRRRRRGRTSGHRQPAPRHDHRGRRAPEPDVQRVRDPPADRFGANRRPLDTSRARCSAPPPRSPGKLGPRSRSTPST